MDNCQVKILGKFKDTNALIKAYQSLQREYTKKCQRLKSLEAQECTKHDDKNKYYDFASDIEYASTSKEISLEDRIEIARALTVLGYKKIKVIQ